MLRPRILLPFSVCLPVFLSACATAGGTFAPLGPDHPASADAPELPIEDPSAILRAPEAARDAEPAASERAPGTYVCPMHAEVTAGAPGVCPKCGMRLVPRAEETSSMEHPHGH